MVRMQVRKKLGELSEVMLNGGRRKDGVRCGWMKFCCVNFGREWRRFWGKNPKAKGVGGWERGSQGGRGRERKRESV